jgi:hypothetical protein
MFPSSYMIIIKPFEEKKWTRTQDDALVSALG